MTTKKTILAALDGVKEQVNNLNDKDPDGLQAENAWLVAEVERLKGLLNDQQTAAAVPVCHACNVPLKDDGKCPQCGGEPGRAGDEKARPLTTYYVPIKENLGYRFVVWPTNLSIEKVSKDLENGRWERLGSMSLTRRSVEFLATRAGSMLEQWDATMHGTN